MFISIFLHLPVSDYLCIHLHRLPILPVICESNYIHIYLSKPLYLTTNLTTYLHVFLLNLPYIFSICSIFYPQSNLSINLLALPTYFVCLRSFLILNLSDQTMLLNSSRNPQSSWTRWFNVIITNTFQCTLSQITPIHFIPSQHIFRWSININFPNDDFLWDFTINCCWNFFFLPCHCRNQGQLALRVGSLQTQRVFLQNSSNECTHKNTTKFRVWPRDGSGGPKWMLAGISSIIIC
jgi:hypothetical protein